MAALEAEKRGQVRDRTEKQSGSSCAENKRAFFGGWWAGGEGLADRVNDANPAGWVGRPGPVSWVLGSRRAEGGLGLWFGYKVWRHLVIALGC